MIDGASIGGDGGPQPGAVDLLTVITTATTTDITGLPNPGMRIVADDIMISTDTAQTVSIVDGASNVLRRFYMAANQTIPVTQRNRVRAIVVDVKLRAVSSQNGNLAIHCSYHSEPL